MRFECARPHGFCADRPRTNPCAASWLRDVIENLTEHPALDLLYPRFGGLDQPGATRFLAVCLQPLQLAHAQLEALSQGHHRLDLERSATSAWANPAAACAPDRGQMAENRRGSGWSGLSGRRFRNAPSS